MLNEIYAFNEDDLKENDIIQDDDSFIHMVVSKSQENATYIRRRLELCWDNFLKSKSNKKTHVLTDNADINAVGNIPKVVVYGIIKKSSQTCCKSFVLNDITTKHFNINENKIQVYKSENWRYISILVSKH